MSSIMNKDIWITELSQAYKTADEIPVSDIADLAQYVGIEAAIKCFNFFNKTPQFFPERNMTEMKREYVRKCYNDQTTDEVARKLSLSTRSIEMFLSEPMPKKKENLSIPMFPEM